MIVRGFPVLVGLALAPLYSQAQPSEEQTALDSFKKLVRRHTDSYKSGGREHITQLGGGWVKELFTLNVSSANFDVEKTALRGNS
jgi:hypothetical protein